MFQTVPFLFPSYATLALIFLRSPSFNFLSSHSINFVCLFADSVCQQGGTTLKHLDLISPRCAQEQWLDHVRQLIRDLLTGLA